MRLRTRTIIPNPKQAINLETKRSSKTPKGWNISKKVRKLFRTKEFFIATKDKFSIYKNGMFLEKVRLGTIFPYVRGKDKDSYLVVRKHGSLKGLISNITISRDFIKKAPITFNAINLNILTNELINEPYGWGGTFQARDCSELTRDFLSPFGIFLARNSKYQTKNGKYLSLKDLSNDEKKKFLIKNAATMGIYKPVDYKKKPKRYCGMTISDNPYYDL